MKLLLIAPDRSDVGFKGTTYDPYDAAYQGIEMIPSTALPTVAAMAPKDIEVVLCSETTGAIDYDTDADVIGITVNVAQVKRALHIAEVFRQKGKFVVMGGAHVSLVPHLFEDHCDCMVVGELEAIAETFFQDMLDGCLKPRYDGTAADMTTSPAPRWDLYPHQRSMVGVVQTSRGCPFKCTFCDVIQFVGNKQRHKTNEQVLKEVQSLYNSGFGFVFIADDNFSANKKVARSMLHALRDWNGTDGRGFMTFQTQMSINTMLDDDFLTSCYEAGLTKAFVGLETSDPAALEECDKKSNQRLDPVALSEKSYRLGVEVEPSLIVGFDSDDKTVFNRQLSFAMSLPTLAARMGALVAPSATPLYADMRAQGRLLHDIKSVEGIPNPYFSNFRPAQMTRAELYIGLRWMISRFFDPASYLQRLPHVIGLLQPPPWMVRGTARPMEPRPSAVTYTTAVLKTSAALDPRLKGLIEATIDSTKGRPEIMTSATSSMVRYLAAFSSLTKNGMYDPAWAKLDAPPFDVTYADERLDWLRNADAHLSNAQAG